MDADEWRFFLTGLPLVSTTAEAAATVGPAEPEPNPAASWLPELAWLELNALSTLPAFHGLAREVRKGSYLTAALILTLTQGAPWSGWEERAVHTSGLYVRRPGLLT